MKILSFLFVLLTSVGTWGQETEVVTHRDWSYQDDQGECVAWTQQGKMNKADGKEAFRLSVGTPKSLKKLPYIVFEVSELLFLDSDEEDPEKLSELQALADAFFENLPSTSTDEKWYFNQVKQQTDEEGNSFRVAEYVVWPQDLYRLSRHIVNDSTLSIELRAKNQKRFRFRVSLIGSTKTFTASVKKCAKRGDSSRHFLSQNNKDFIKKLSDQDTASSSLWEEWSESPLDQLMAIDTAAEEADVLEKDLESLLSEPSYVSVKEELNAETATHKSLEDTIVEDQDLLVGYKQEKQEKSQKKPVLLSKKSVLDQKLPNLENKYKDSQAAYEKAVSEVRPYIEKVQREKSRLSQLEEEEESLQSRKTAAENRLSRLKSELQRKRLSLSNKEQEKRDLTESREDLEISVDNLKSRKERIRRDIENQSNYKFDTIDGLIGESRRKFQGLEARSHKLIRIENLNNEALNKIDQLKRLQREIETLPETSQGPFDTKTLSQELESKRQELAQLNCSNKKGPAKLACRAAKKALRAAISQLVKKIENQSSTGSSSSEKKQKLRERKRKLKRDLSRIQDNIASIGRFPKFHKKNEFQRCQANKNNNFCQVEARGLRQGLVNHKEGVRNRKTKLAQQIRQAERQKSWMHREFNNRYTNPLQEKMRLLDSYDDQIFDLNEDIFDLKNEVNDLRFGITQLQNEALSLHSQWSQKRNEVSDQKFTVQNAQAEKNTKALQVQLVQKKKAYENAESQFSETEARYEALTFEIQNIEERLQVLNQKIPEKEIEIKKNQSLVALHGQKVKDLQVQIEPFEKEIQEKEVEIQENQKLYESLISQWVGFLRSH